MKKGLSVYLPNQTDMKDGRVVEHHQTIGAEVKPGAIVLTVQIHDRTLQFKSPAVGKLNSIAPLGTLPSPGDLLFRLMVEENPEPEPENEVFNTASSASANTSDSTAEKATQSHQGASPAPVSGSLLSKVMAPVRMGLGALMWLMLGSALAGAYVLATDGGSPIGGWVPENRITLFDGAINGVSELHIDWIKGRQLDRYEKDDRWAEVRKDREERKERAEGSSASDDQGGVSNLGTREVEASKTKSQQSSGQSYQENVRPCSVRDESCDPEVHVLCQLRVGSYSGEERWRNPIQSYMCAPQPVKYSNGMWRQGYADGTEACREHFGENAFQKSSFSRNSGFVSSAQHQSDTPSAACVDACKTVAAKFNKRCTGLPQSSS